MHAAAPRMAAAGSDIARDTSCSAVCGGVGLSSYKDGGRLAADSARRTVGPLRLTCHPGPQLHAHADPKPERLDRQLSNGHMNYIKVKQNEQHCCS